MKNVYDVILRPVLTEASYEGIEDKRYVFEVAKTANRTEIKQALETIFKGVKVENVNTLRTLGKKSNFNGIKTLAGNGGKCCYRGYFNRG